MKIRPLFFSPYTWSLRCLLLTLLITGVLTPLLTRAGLTVSINLYHTQYGYYTYGFLDANATPPAFPDGDYTITTPNYPATGSQIPYHAASGNLTSIAGGSGGYFPDYAALMNDITNGFWSIWVTNGGTTQYKFRVTITGLTSNIFGAPPLVTYPQNDALNVPNSPTFTWSGPANWFGNVSTDVQFIDDNGDYNYVDSASLPASATSWTPTVSLPVGTNQFFVNYYSNINSMVSSTIPTNSSGTAISGWLTTGNLTAQGWVDFVVTGNAFDQYLVARYNFENPGQAGKDTSGNANDANCSGSSGPNVDVSSTNAAVNSLARKFFGESSICFTPGGDAFPNLSNALSGSFTVTAWVKTTGSVGADDDDAYWGMPVFFADGDGINYTEPLSITGSKAAFTVYDENGDPTTVHSSTSVNDGNYHFLAVTRHKTSGALKLYVDGNLESTATGTTQPLAPFSACELAGGNGHYEGLMDDVRIYSTNLTADTIATLAGTLGSGGGHTNLVHYSFEDNDLFAHDFSGNDNDISGYGWFSIPPHMVTNSAAAGTYSVNFSGSCHLSPPTNLIATLAGDFTVSVWVKTSATYGNNNDNPLFSAAILTAYDFETSNEVIPMSITGSKVAFLTGGSSTDTLRSQANINTGQYVHVAVTRNRTSGEKKIYINGVLDATGSGSTELLGDSAEIKIGEHNGSGFVGDMDDLQIYSGVLSASEIAALYAAPGSVIPDSTGSGGTTNITVDLILSVFRIKPPSDPEYFLCYPFSTISPAALTTHEIHSPNGLFTYSSLNNGPSSSGISTFSQLMTEITNGAWTIFINKTHPSEKQFTFNVAAAGVTTNLLQKVIILSPTNGSTGVPSVPTYSWTGASGLTYLQATLNYTNTLFGYTNLPPSATGWTNPPALPAGTNQLDVTYFSIGVTNFSFTLPVDGNSVPLSGWTTRADFQSSATSIFVVGSGTTPIQLANPNRTSGNFQFQFLSQSGKTNTVQSRTNLTLGVWIDRTNILGDGSTKTITLPVSSAPTEFFRVSTQ